MNYFIIFLIYLFATFTIIKSIFYGIYELKQQNTFGGIFVITFCVLSYLLFVIMFSFVY